MTGKPPRILTMKQLTEILRSLDYNTKPLRCGFAEMRLEILLFLGTAAADMTPRIVGGEIANIRDWPFIAFVVVFGKTTATTCGGSLISAQTVLTAAHCLDDVTDSKKNFADFKYSILMGHTRFSKATMIRDCLDYLSHQKYDPAGVTYDIGILFLVRPVEFSDTVKKAILMRQLDPVSDRDLEVAGWGAWTDSANTTLTSSPFLKVLNQPLYPTSLCVDLLNEYGDDEIDGVLCAGYVNATEFVFSGDSGGPIVTKGSRIQAGLVSFRMEAHGLSVYTSIPHYYRWIEEAQWQLYDTHCLEMKLRHKDNTRLRREGFKKRFRLLSNSSARHLSKVIRNIH